jgi:hypothetical protein
MSTLTLERLAFGIQESQLTDLVDFEVVPVVTSSDFWASQGR